MARGSHHEDCPVERSDLHDTVCHRSHLRPEQDHVLYDAEFRSYHETCWPEGIPRDQPLDRWVRMGNWDLTSVGLVLIGSSITAAGTIIAALLMGVAVDKAPFLLLTTTVLIVMSAILIIYKTPRSPPPI